MYNGLMEMGHEVYIYETFQSENLDHLFENYPEVDAYIISLWSYPQIEIAFLLAQFIPFEIGRDNVYFVGYRPLIEELGLRYVDQLLGFDPMQDYHFLERAMRTYPKNYKDFSKLLLSDCDMHIKDKEQGKKVYPLFTTYGCPHGCAFCPSTKNCGKQRVIVPTGEVFKMLDALDDEGIRYIHFTDEDFFFDIDRANKILSFLSLRNFHMIALGGATAVKRFIDKYGTEILEESGMEVIEIGFESASQNLSTSMGAGKSLTDCEALALNQHLLPSSIFWLVQTFFLGETITSLNDTGRFMKKFGFKMDEVVGRLRTNGTIGGLGQFFQPYHGTPIYSRLEKKGVFLTRRPVRLMPSYLPASFLNSIIREIRPENYEEAIPWLELYNIRNDRFSPDGLKIGTSPWDYMENKLTYEKMQTAIALAVLARMEVIL
jgi:radical SAM superfamily enzyme YgiQ (UPF0313 family)